MKKIMKDGAGIFMLSKKEHFLFWFLMLVYFGISLVITGRDVKLAIYTYLFFLPFQLIGAYFLIYVLLGKFLYKQKYISAILGFISFIFIFSFFVYYIHDYYFRTYFMPDLKPSTFMEMLGNFEWLIIFYMKGSLLIPLILTCIEFILYQYNKIVEVEQLQLQKNEAELNLLKTQIHPHFLLSTLRNLETLTKNESDQGPEVIEKLSETLDYILYKGQEKFVPLKLELAAVKEYLALENIRFENSLKISWDSNIEDEDVLVSPLVLFSFLEFNFKEWKRDNIPYQDVDIKISGLAKSLDVRIINTTKSGSLAGPYDIDKMKRQLDISYPNAHSLTIDENAAHYSIHLKIHL